jgi:hypothetical protein
VASLDSRRVTVREWCRQPNKVIVSTLVTNVVHRFEESSRDAPISSKSRRFRPTAGGPTSCGSQGPGARKARKAEMVGTTRSRMNVLMKTLQRLGFIDYKKGLTGQQRVADVLRD